MSEQHSDVVVVCILNWGLGHATRCIPVINRLREKGKKVILASDGRASQLLKKEFSDVDLIELQSYSVNYPFRSMILNLMYQWPGIVYAMIREHFQVRRIVREHAPSLIISDNRYGCFHSSAYNVCITHQINPPTRTILFDFLGRLISRLLLKNFQRVWIPDDPAFGPLNGKMVSSPPSHSRFIGFISRFQNLYQKQSPVADILAVLSGPEPARTRFEKKIIRQLEDSGLTYKLVRGKTEGQSVWKDIGKNGRATDYLTSDQLLRELLSVRMVVSRSGFSSLMDYLRLGVGALVIPTPGQYEQEYLIERLPEDGYLMGQSEKDMDVLSAYDQLKAVRAIMPYRSDLLSKELAITLSGSERPILASE
ncbi:MAG: hypothetical protein R3275_08310 [Saprospiraceae bacterium]|nr:hypothetical protein [Saprospiraceae bacterium]